MNYFSKKNLSQCVGWLRIALGIIFLWFGVLKFGNSPAFGIIRASFPIFADGYGAYFLATLETLIGLFLIFNVWVRITLFVLVLHLLGTLSVFIIAPHLMFDPYFPFLTLEGEFVVKNIALILGAFVLLCHEAE